jgi:dTMP kinase
MSACISRNNTGINLVIEGPDGSGKGTLIRGLVEYLQNERGIDPVVTAHPGHTRLGKEVRHIVKYRKDLNLDAYTEQVLLAADLCDFIQSVLKPAIEKGKVVLSDRSNFISGMIYGYAGGAIWDEIMAYHHISLAVKPPKMDLILLYGDYDTLKQRHHHDKIVVKGKEEEVECKIQNRGDNYHREVADYYSEVAFFSEIPYFVNKLEQDVGFDQKRDISHIYNQPYQGIHMDIGNRTFHIEAMIERTKTLTRQRFGTHSIWPIPIKYSPEVVLACAKRVVDRLVS